MAQWYVRELSALTGISVRTLHHYDKIGLLKPSVRLPNGYRRYSEADLARLQQILALKFFGFGLAQIRTIMRMQLPDRNAFELQHQLMRQQLTDLHRVLDVLQDVLAAFGAAQKPSWQEIVHLIKGYHMITDLKKSWAGKVFSEDQLKQFVQLHQKLAREISPAEFENYSKAWDDLVKRVRAQLHEDPCGPVGKKLAHEWMTLANQWYSDYPELREAIWNAYKAGKIKPESETIRFPDKSGKVASGGDIANLPKIEQAIIDWIDKASKTL